MALIEQSAQLSIGPASQTDAADIARLHASVFSRGWTEDEIRALFKGTGAIAFIARTDQIAAAFILARAPAAEAEIISIATRHEFRRQGLASQLLAHLHHALEAKTCDAVFLEVDERNTGAVRLYSEVGYRRVGIRRDYYKLDNGRRSNALVLKKTLDS